MSIGKKQSELILVIDDDPEILQAISSLLKADKYRCKTYLDPIEAIDSVRTCHPDVVISDLHLPEVDGIYVMARIHEVDRDIPTILITGYGAIKSAIDAIRRGAFDFLEKPVKPALFLEVIDKALAHRRQLVTSNNLRRELDSQSRFDDMIGRSNTMRSIFRIIEKTSATDLSVMIFGESGTGKELVARSIHKNSKRSEHPFIVVDCGSIPGNLIESELFGYEKGAFTGATEAKQGLLESANGGTLFLDELVELDLELQTRLLRVLQEQHTRRIGGRTWTDLDIRVIAASNQRPEKAIAACKLREDLYYRLNVIPIDIPPLRERIDDIPLLINHFVSQITARYPKFQRTLAPEALAALQTYRWPGNVRELKNLVERMMALTSGDIVSIGNIPISIIENVTGYAPRAWMTTLPFKAAKEKHIEYFERNYIQCLLEKFDGNVSHAAAHAEIDRKTIQRLMQKYDIDKPDVVDQA